MRVRRRGVTIRRDHIRRMRAMRHESQSSRWVPELLKSLWPHLCRYGLVCLSLRGFGLDQIPHRLGHKAVPRFHAIVCAWRCGSRSILLLVLHLTLHFRKQDGSTDLVPCPAASRLFDVPLEVISEIVAPAERFGGLAEFTAPCLRVIRVCSGNPSVHRFRLRRRGRELSLTRCNASSSAPALSSSCHCTLGIHIGVCSLGPWRL
jgi:hypothetical protein